METNSHSLRTLFGKMDLLNEHIDIEEFVTCNQLADNEDLISAHFWTQEQRDFLQRAYRPHSHWIEQIEILEARLRQDLVVSD